MPLMSEADREKLRQHFERELDSLVTISLYTRRPSPIFVPGRECRTCEPTQKLLTEVTSLSEKLELRIRDVDREDEAAGDAGITRIPAIVIAGETRGELRFFGLPAGNEFPNLIDALVDASKGATSLGEGSRERLAVLEKKVHIQVFTTPT